MNTAKEETQAVAHAEQRKIVRIGGNDVDFSDYPPLTLGDRRKLKTEYGLDLKKMSAFTEEDEDKFVLFLVRKLRPSTTEAELSELPMKIAGDLAAHAMRCAAEVESPFSRRLTSLPTNTAGTSES